MNTPSRTSTTNFEFAFLCSNLAGSYIIWIYFSCFDIHGQFPSQYTQGPVIITPPQNNQFFNVFAKIYLRSNRSIYQDLDTLPGHYLIISKFWQRIKELSNYSRGGVMVTGPCVYWLGNQPVYSRVKSEIYVFWVILRLTGSMRRGKAELQICIIRQGKAKLRTSKLTSVLH